MRVKQDAVPGFTMPVWFVPNRVGEYEIACSQLCGLGHFRMRGFVNIKTDTDYKAWLDEEAKALTQ
jgi:cytochrome c oxidase subunit 2